MHQQLFYQATAQHLPLNLPLTNHLLNYPLSFSSSYPLSQPLYSLETAYKELLIRNQNMRALQFQNLLQQQDFKYPQYAAVNPMKDFEIFSPPNSLNLGFKDLSLPKELNYLKAVESKISNPPQPPTLGSRQASKTEIGACLRKKLEKMIRSIMSSVNNDSQSEINKGRELYMNEPIFLKLYDTLVMRFNELQDAGIAPEDEDGLLEFFMPYKKNSKNRTMNSSFIDDIFSSPEFCHEYRSFLANQFERFLVADNNRKIKKLVDLMVVCIEKNDVAKLVKFSRLPWLGAWLQDARDYAQSLLPSKPARNDRKIIKFDL